MKHSYVSVVLTTSTTPTQKEIEKIDAALNSCTRAHEIVIVTPYGQPEVESVTTSGPVTVVTTHIRSTQDAAIIAGLARAVGDFILEWRGSLDHLDTELITHMLSPTDTGIELVEVTGQEHSAASRMFGNLVNRLRPAQAPLRKTIGRTYSRHAVQEVLGATAFEPQLDVLTSELAVRRSQHPTTIPNSHHPSFAQRITNGFTLLSKGTRFGSAIPLTLAAVSALFGMAAAFYSLGFLLINRRTPEGWTTLMIVIGLGQATVLTMLGLTWTRIDALARGLSRNPDSTAAVHIIAPKDPQI